MRGESEVLQLEGNMISISNLSRPDGTLITSWDQWTRPKKKDVHWADERSAMELAKAWFRGGQLSVPAELSDLFASSPRLEGLQLMQGVPELVTHLPERGEGRNHDLWLRGCTPRESVTICIEAKADEPFGNHTVAEYRDFKPKDKEGNPRRTRVPARIEELLRLVGGTASVWDTVMYQLLTAICGTVIQAQKDFSNLAVFVVHEFRTNKTIEKNLQRNGRDFAVFLQAIGVDPPAYAEGRLLGPVMISGMDCMIGKIEKEMRG